MRESDWVFFCFQNTLMPQAMFNPLQQHLLKYDDRARFFKYFISINISLGMMGLNAERNTFLSYI